MTLPSNARTADVSPSSLDRYTVRDFYAARAGKAGAMTADEYDYLLTRYVQAVNPDGYGRMVAEYRAMLASRIVLDQARLVVTLPYGSNRDVYARLGLPQDPRRCRARVAELERKARAAARAYIEADAAQGTDREPVKDWAEAMAREVAVLSRYLGFAIDPDHTAVGVYIGYLSLIVSESVKKGKE